MPRAVTQGSTRVREEAEEDMWFLWEETGEAE